MSTGPESPRCWRRSQRVSLLGLTYKPGSSTLRRSRAVEVAQLLHAEGAMVVAFDPAVRELPPEIGGALTLAASSAAALQDADAVVLATPWPEFSRLPW